MLIPFLGKYAETSNDPDFGRFNEWESAGKELFEIVTDPVESDFFLLPFGYSFSEQHQKITDQFLNKAKQYSKKTLIFYNSDDDTIIDRPNTFVFRTSLNKSLKLSNEFALPGWSVDFANYFPDKNISYLSKEMKPSISYCGYVGNHQKSLTRSIKSFLSKGTVTTESNARILRGLACDRLMKNKNVQAQFIIRDGFWATGIEDKIAARREYANNMISSMYAIVVRGAGNFSYRLFEVLSCGRIPVFINTDSVLPFDDVINWKNHLVWIEEKDADKVDKRLVDFHHSKTNEELIQLQKSNRELYLQFISPLGFFRTLPGYIKTLS